jgi:hypothetical protein
VGNIIQPIKTMTLKKLILLVKINIRRMPPGPLLSEEVMINLLFWVLFL